VNTDFDQNRAAEALAAMDRSRARLATAADVSPLRHLAFALVIGGWIATPALAQPWRAMAMAGLFVSVPLMVLWDRRRTGTFVNGYRAGRTLPVTIAMVVAALGLLIASVRLANTGAGPTASIALAAIAVAGVYAGSRWWSRVYRRELTGTGE